MIEVPSSESNSDETESIAISISSDVSDSSNDVPCAKRRRALKKSRSRATENEAKDTIDDRLIQKAIDVMEKSDELDIFGQFVASEMRQMTNTAVVKVVKAEIMKIILHYSAQESNYSVFCDF